ncbi:Ribosomal lysine N-methyltransferase 2 [Erysiphe necator]|nr:Ribosomal lysine N-methyltransferase 2 [Erysiphe necator]
MDIHQEFTEWAQQRGLEIIDIKAQNFHGRGMGIMATKDIRANTMILRVPHLALRTQNTVSQVVLDAIKGLQRISVHGLLAMDHIFQNFRGNSNTTATKLTSPAGVAATPIAEYCNIDGGGSNDYSDNNCKPWHNVLPKFSDIQECMPLCWSASLQKLLPPISKRLLHKQRQKLQKDWNIASMAWPHLVYDNYLYAWLLINTRTFYFILSAQSYSGKSHSRINSSRDNNRGTSIHRDDCMALNPFADYFNQNFSPSASVQITKNAFEIHTLRNVNAQEEITICYGNHSNDFLLAEYGFFLNENPWDEVLLDDYIFPLLNSSQKKKLKSVDFLGNYILDRNSVCYRTQVVLRILCLSLSRWEDFVKGLDDGDMDQPQIDQILSTVIIRFRQDIQKILAKISLLDNNYSTQKALLSNRWSQIDTLLETILKK